MAKEDHKPSKPELADHGIYPDRFVEVSRNYLCFSNSNGGRVTQRTTEYAKPEGRAARSLNEVAPENGHQSAFKPCGICYSQRSSGHPTIKRRDRNAQISGHLPWGYSVDQQLLSRF